MGSLFALVSYFRESTFTVISHLICFKDTLTENKAEALIKNSMRIWVNGNKIFKKINWLLAKLRSL